MVHKIAKLYTKKVMRKRRKLRSLVSKETPDENTSSSLRTTGLLLFAVCAVAVVAIGLHLVSWSDFLITYRDQYNQLVHGEKDYCKPVMNTQTLFQQIIEEVLNQNQALRTIEQQLRNDSKFTAIAVVGRTGVGKTLFAQALHDYFPWQENIQMFSWRNYESRKREKVESAFGYLSDCGRNLIIIDDLTLDDLNFVQEYTNLAMENVAKSKANLIILYVMNVASFTEEQRVVYEEKVDQVRGLENVNVVEFDKFGADELRDCILQETKNLRYTLDDDSLAEVIKLIDVDRSGCKNVHPKVLIYGQLAE